MKLLDIDELGALLKRSPETIRKDLRRNHLAVPPRLHTSRSQAGQVLQPETCRNHLLMRPKQLVV